MNIHSPALFIGALKITSHNAQVGTAYTLNTENPGKSLDVIFL
jgi:hypothetical protein